MKIKHILSVFALMGALTACDDYNDQFDFLDNVGLTDVKNLEMSLGGSDYATIADSKANQDLAAVLSDKKAELGIPEEVDLAQELANLKDNKFFTQYARAEWYVPAFLAGKYVEATDGSRIKVAYNEYRDMPQYMDGLDNVKSYTLTDKDYAGVWGAERDVKYLTPQSLSKMSEILKGTHSNAANGDKVIVNYAYSDVEPSGNVQPIVAYVPVKEIAEDGGRYIVAALADDGKYYAFGNTASWSKNYGYFENLSALTLNGGNVLLADGEAEELIFEKGSKGYFIKDHNGYYLYMTSNYENFNRKNSQPTGDGVEWSVTPNADGTVSLTNIDKEKTVKLNYYKNKLQYGSYPESTWTGLTYFEDECSTLASTKFTMKDVTLPAGSTYVWKVDESNKYWKGSAYVGGKNNDAESYIVSSEIDLMDAKSPVLTWTECLNYAGKGPAVEDITAWVSEDYAGDVKAATWTKLSSEVRASGKNWTKAYPEVDLSAYKGKKVWIAFKYISNTSGSCTWEVWDVKVADKSNYWDVCLFKGMTQSEMNEAGVAVAAKSVKATRAGEVQPTNSVMYAYDAEDKVWYVYEPDGANLAVVDPAAYASIGMDRLNKPAAQIPVFLARNYPYATNGMVVVVVYTNAEKEIAAAEYKYASGVWKEQTDMVARKLNFNLENKVWVAGANSYYENTLQGDKGGFTDCNVNLGEGLTYVWTNDSQYGWKASAYKGSAKAAESWLVSPAISLADAEAPVLNFDEAINYCTSYAEMLTIWITTDADKYNETTPDVSVCNWIQIVPENRGLGDDWTFVNTGNIDLSEYNGETIRIAFKYTSSDAMAATWEFKNFSVAELSE